MLKTLHRIHAICTDSACYALIVASLSASALVFGRWLLTGSNNYFFLWWNVVLAWIPYICSLVLVTRPGIVGRQRFVRYLLVFIWFLFFPNAPYMVTDFVHLPYNIEGPRWYDIGMLVSFAWVGLLLGVVSLRMMHQCLSRSIGNVLSWLFILGMAAYTGISIYVGRYLRLNSWDALVAPITVIKGLHHDIAEHRLQVIGVTGMFAMLLVVCYLTSVALSGAFATQRHDR